MGLNLRSISITMLMVFTLLPVSGTLCAIICDTAAQSEGSDHHHAAAPEASRSAAPDVPVINGPSAHPCDHAPAIQQATTAAERTQIAISAPPGTLVGVEAFAAPPIRQVRPPQGAPPGNTPSTSTPIVLRV